MLAAALSAAAYRHFDPDAIPPWSDWWDYLQLGRQLRTGHGFTSLFTYPLFLPYSHAAAGQAFPLLWRPPLYPMMLGLASIFTHDSSATPLLLQVVFYLVTILATYLLALEFTGRRWALLSGLVVALHPALIGLAEPGLATTPYAALLALSMRLALRADTRRRAVVTGLAFGLLTLLRGEALILFPAVVWLLWAGERGDRERRIWLFLAAAFAATLPWILRNWIVTGRPFFGTSSLLFTDTRDFPGWISSRMSDTLSHSALIWALTHPNQLAWKFLKNFYHYLTQALLLPLAPLAPFVWAAAGRLTRIGRESAYCASVLIGLALTALLLSPLEYAPRFLDPFIPLLTVVGVVMLDRMRELVDGGEEIRRSPRPAVWVAGAVVTLSALQFLGGLHGAREQRARWEVDSRALRSTNWDAVRAALPPGTLVEADYPGYYAWKTGRTFVWWRVECEGTAPALLALERSAGRPDPTGLPATGDLVARASDDARPIDGVVFLARRPCP
jgi:hypothetical protein